MKTKSNFLLALGFLLATLIGSDTKAEELSKSDSKEFASKQSDIDIGRIKKGEVLVRDFELSNPFDSAFKITEFGSSCSCTVSTIKKGVYGAGEPIPLQLSIEPTQSGAFGQSVLIQGLVDGRPAAFVLKILARVYAPLELSNASGAWIVRADRPISESTLKTTLCSHWDSDRSREPSISLSSTEVSAELVKRSESPIEGADACWDLILRPDQKLLSSDLRQIIVSIEHFSAEGESRVLKRIFWIVCKRRLTVFLDNIQLGRCSAEPISDSRYYFNVLLGLPLESEIMPESSPT